MECPSPTLLLTPSSNTSLPARTPYINGEKPNFAVKKDPCGKYLALKFLWHNDPHPRMKNPTLLSRNINYLVMSVHIQLLTPPYLKWYNPNARHEYHVGISNHSTRTAPFKFKV